MEGWLDERVPHLWWFIIRLYRDEECSWTCMMRVDALVNLLVIP